MENKRILSVFGGLIVAGVAGYMGYISLIQEPQRRRNLEEDALWAGGDQFESQNGKAFLKNKDLDGNRRDDSVIRYVGRDGEYCELQIRMREDGLPEIVHPDSITCR